MKTHPCPSCGKESYYLAAPDRAFHEDGSDTRECWFNLHRHGVTYPLGRIVGARSLLNRCPEWLAIRTVPANGGTAICLQLDWVADGWPDDVPVAVRQVTEDVVAALDEEGIQAYGPDRPVLRCKPSRAGVYFLRSGEHLKIGESGNVPQRMRELATGNPRPLRLMACEPIAERMPRVSRERAYHDRWRDLRVPGTEWFTWTRDLNVWVHSLIENGHAFSGEEMP